MSRDMAHGERPNVFLPTSTTPTDDQRAALDEHIPKLEP